jgi:hypothetical protein
LTSQFQGIVKRLLCCGEYDYVYVSCLPQKGITFNVEEDAELAFYVFDVVESTVERPIVCDCDERFTVKLSLHYLKIMAKVPPELSPFVCLKLAPDMPARVDYTFADGDGLFSFHLSVE